MLFYYDGINESVHANRLICRCISIREICTSTSPAGTPLSPAVIPAVYGRDKGFFMQYDLHILEFKYLFVRDT